MVFVVTDRWRRACPDAMVAALIIRNAPNVAVNEQLQQRKLVVESQARARFSNVEKIKADPTIQAYISYYRRFQKTYHLVQQLRTLVEKQRPLPTISGLLDAMFMAEMSNLLLTAGHDLATVVPPVTLDAASGEEVYLKLNQEMQQAKAGDMAVSDALGILSSIIHGPDFRSRLTDATTDALYIVYAPSGITRESLLGHARDITANIRLFAPSAAVEPVWLLTAHGIDIVAL